jgi:hypothetical protein
MTKPSPHLLLLELAREASSQYQLVDAACRMAQHAEGPLYDQGLAPLPSSLEIVFLTQKWLQDGKKEAGSQALRQVTVPVDRVNEPNKLPGPVWAHYMACSHLAHMLQEQGYTSPGDLIVKRLTWVAAQACNAVTFSSAASARSRAQSKEATWQIECLRSILGLRDSSQLVEGPRLRNSLLAEQTLSQISNELGKDD